MQITHSVNKNDFISFAKINDMLLDKLLVKLTKKYFLIFLVDDSKVCSKTIY